MWLVWCNHGQGMNPPGSVPIAFWEKLRKGGDVAYLQVRAACPTPSLLFAFQVDWVSYCMGSAGVWSGTRVSEHFSLGPALCSDHPQRR